jgi:hypothetical protein
MGLFKPKAPKAPEGVAYQFHFAGDDRNPDGSFKQPPSELPIAPAVERVALEIAKLRGNISGGNGVADSAALRRDIEKAKCEIETASKALELKRRQFAGGTVAADDLSKASREFDQRCALFRSLHDELRKREQADQAQAELARILEALR